MKKILAAVILAAALVPAVASAEGARACPRNVVCLEGESFEIQIPRPRAFYVIDRARLQHDTSTADQSFTSDVVESVERGPF